jgi:hypothetical protein
MSCKKMRQQDYRNEKELTDLRYIDPYKIDMILGRRVRGEGSGGGGGRGGGRRRRRR